MSDSTAPSDLELRAHLERALSSNYEIDREIGRGGMGIVYRATDRRLKRTVAIKLLPPELAFRPDVRSRFLREAETAAQLSHPNIVPIYSVDERDRLVYFIMGHVAGQNLAERLSRSAEFPVADARRVLREVADALAYAHARGVVHRDIKPDNILLDADTGRAMVTDFGIARAVESSDSRLTATGVAIGTPAYMSPEQCAGERQIDGRSDLYSLGVVAYQMLAGEPPFSASSTPAMMLKHVSEQPVPVERRRVDVPADLAEIVGRLLEKNPADRFPDGAALVAALDSGGHLAPRPPRMGKAPAPVEPKERRPGRRERFDSLPEPERVRRFRKQLFAYASTSVFLFGINAATGPEFWWAIFPTLGMGLGMMKMAGSLWADGVRWRDVFGAGSRRALPDGDARVVAAPGERPLPAAAVDETSRLLPREVLGGPYEAAVRQAVGDRHVVRDLVAALGEADRALLPDVAATADALVERMAALAGALHRLDADIAPERLPKLDQRIAALEAMPAQASDRERTLALLRRQRSVLRDLLASRAGLLEQLESAGLLLQNMRLDLLKLRSAGVQAVLQDVNSATQEARALAREIGYVLDAARELRSLEETGRSG